MHLEAKEHHGLPETTRSCQKPPGAIRSHLEPPEARTQPECEFSLRASRKKTNHLDIFSLDIWPLDSERINFHYFSLLAYGHLLKQP